MFRPLIALGAAATLSAVAGAQKPLRAADIPVSQAATEAATAFHTLKIGRALVYPRVRKLIDELTWHKRLDEALGAARQAGKPVLWIQALGRLTGYV